MRTTLDLPEQLMKKVKLHALREGLTLKDWFVRRLTRDLEDRDKPGPADEAARFRKRFKGRFEPEELDDLKRRGRA